MNRGDINITVSRSNSREEVASKKVAVGVGASARGIPTNIDKSGEYKERIISGSYKALTRAENGFGNTLVLEDTGFKIFLTGSNIVSKSLFIGIEGRFSDGVRSSFIGAPPINQSGETGALKVSSKEINNSATPVLAGETTDKIGITMVDIPAGSFVMGSCTRLTSSLVKQNEKRASMGIPLIKAPTCLAGSPNTDYNTSEIPQRLVTIRAFQLGKTEVTLAQFKKFIDATGGIVQAKDSLNVAVDKDFMKRDSGFNNVPDGDNVPATSLSWDDAKAFIDWLNKTDGGGWRLPTEAEWEYACRAGGHHKYCGSDDVNNVAWHSDNSGGRLHAVASKQANAFGLYDMSGSVSEWVEDCSHDYENALSNGDAWTSSGCSLRGVRGGSFHETAMNVTAGIREFRRPSFRAIRYGYGFRLARTR